MRGSGAKRHERHREHPRVVFGFTIVDAKIVGIEIIADPDRLGELEVAMVD